MLCFNSILLMISGLLVHKLWQSHGLSFMKMDEPCSVLLLVYVKSMLCIGVLLNVSAHHSWLRPSRPGETNRYSVHSIFITHHVYHDPWRCTADLVKHVTSYFRISLLIWQGSSYQGVSQSHLSQQDYALGLWICIRTTLSLRVIILGIIPYPACWILNCLLTR